MKRENVVNGNNLLCNNIHLTLRKLPCILPILSRAKIHQLSRKVFYCCFTLMRLFHLEHFSLFHWSFGQFLLVNYPDKKAHLKQNYLMNIISFFWRKSDCFKCHFVLLVFFDNAFVWVMQWLFLFPLRRWDFLVFHIFQTKNLKIIHYESL